MSRQLVSLCCLVFTACGASAATESSARGGVPIIAPPPGVELEPSASTAESADEGAPVALGQAAPDEPKGVLDKDEIRRVVRSHHDGIRACYEVALARDPYERGRIEVRFLIGVDGKVVTASVFQSTLTDPRLERCIVDEAKTWVFPKPEGGGIVTVTYPFTLSSS
jgi:outer membrane biosynthesis protein TonB